MTSHDATYPAKISELAPSPNNPRTIDDLSADGLRASLAEMGDVSGITHNIRTGTLVAGHQRVEQLKRLYGNNLAIVPPKDGSDRGYIECPNGDLFAVRFVDWDATRHNAAMLAANSPLLAGAWTAELSLLLDRVSQDLGPLCEQLRFDDLYRDTKRAMAGMTSDAELLQDRPDDSGTVQPRIVLTLPPRVWLVQHDAVIAAVEQLAAAWGLRVDWPESPRQATPGFMG